MANMHFKADLLPSTDLGYSLGSSDERWKINGLTGGPIEYIVDTKTGTSSAWTGVTKDSTLEVGKVIAFKITNAPSGNASLQLTFTNPPDGEATTTAAIPVYLNNTRVTTHYANGSVVLMVYDGTYWRSTDYWNSNSRDAGYGKITPAQSTAETAITTNTTQLAAATYNEAMTVSAGNKWIQLAGTNGASGADILTIGHNISGVTAGNYGDEGNQTPGYGSTFNVPYISVDAAGHITGISTHTVKIPASDNTWRGIQDNLTSDSATDSLSAKQGKALANGSARDNTKLPLAGGTMTGAIQRYYSAASTDPVLSITSNDKDVTLFNIGHGTAAGIPASCWYRLVYKGTGNSPNNTLQLIAAKSTTESTAVEINEDGMVTFNGTGVFKKTTDAAGTANNSPALIIGGTATQAHIEIDANEIMAKGNGTTTAVLYLNNDGGEVQIGGKVAARVTSAPTSGQVMIADGTGGLIKSSGYTIAKSVPSNAVFTDTTYSAATNGGLSLSGTAFSIKSSGVTNDMLAGSITNAKLVNSKITIGGVDVSLGGSITLADLGLSSAMHFIGKTTTSLTDGATTNPVSIGGSNITAKAGDVVLNGDNKEFVFDGTNWELLGDEGSYKIKQTAIADNTGTSESTTATRFIYSFSQDANGVVSVKTRPLPTYNNYSLPTASISTKGGIKVGTTLAIASEVLNLAAVTQSNTTDSATPTHGGNFTAISGVSVDSYGRVTGVQTKTITLPSDNNTDTKVNVKTRGTTKAYIMADTTAPTATAAAHEAVAETAVYMDTTAGAVAATSYKVAEKVILQYNTTTNALDFVFV